MLKKKNSKGVNYISTPIFLYTCYHLEVEKTKLTGTSGSLILIIRDLARNEKAKREMGELEPSNTIRPNGWLCFNGKIYIIHSLKKLCSQLSLIDQTWV